METCTQSAQRRPGFVYWIAALSALALVLCGLATPASAQLTVNDLIGSAVSDLGPKYDDVQKAIDRFRAGDVAGSLEFLKIAKEKHPQLPPPDVTLAKMQAALRNPGAARALLERAIREYPDDAEAYLMLADQAYAEGQLTEADVLYEKAAALVEKMAGNEKRKRAFAIRTQAGRGAIAERRGDFEVAQKFLTAWIEADPESATAHHRLGSTLFRLQKYKEAYDEFNLARKHESSLPHPDVTSAKLFHQMDNQQEAQKFFERAVETDGKNPETLFAYAQWLMEEGNAPAALTPLRNARVLKPDNPQLLLFSGVASKMSGNTEEAEQFLLDALAITPTSQDVLNQLALTLADTDDETKKQRALQFAQVAATLYPQNNESAVTLGWALYRLARLPEAERAIQNATKLGPLNPDSSYLISRILFEQNKLEDAARILDSVVENEGIFVHRNQAEQLRTQIGRQNSPSSAGP
jgi:tetratricopeptide (TPR) repeat protein